MSESMRATESCAALRAAARRLVSAAQAAAESIVPMTGHTRETAGDGSAPQPAPARLRANPSAM
jgi:hypothetical protein